MHFYDAIESDEKCNLVSLKIWYLFLCILFKQSLQCFVRKIYLPFFQSWMCFEIKRVSFCVALVLISGELYSQSSEIENLKKVLKNHPQQDTFRINRLNELSETYTYADPKEIDKVSAEALALSQKLGYAVGEATALIGRSRVALYSGDRTQAIKILTHVDSLATKMNDPLLRFRVILRFAFCHSEKDNRLAVQYALKAESIARSMNDNKLLFKAQLRASELYTNLSDYALSMEYAIKSQNTGMLSNCFDCQVVSWGRIAHVYTLIGNYDLSNLYYQKQLDEYIKTKANNRLVAALHNNFGENYYRIKGKQSEALSHYQKALELDSGVARREVTSINIANLYLEMDSLKLAFKFAFDALRSVKHTDDLVLESWAEEILANAYLKRNKPDSAIYFARLGLANAKSVSNVEFMCNNSLALANAYSIKKNFDSAFRFHKQYVNYRDSILTREIRNKISVMERSNEMKQSQNEIELLSEQKKTQQNLLIAISVILLLVVIAAIELVRSNKQKTKYQHERQLLISTVQTQEDERKRIAQDLHDELGAVLSIARMHIVQIQEDEGNNNLKTGLQQACTLTESALATMRRISHELMPPQLEQFGLIKTLRAIATQTNEARQIEMELIADDDSQRWPVSVERGLYRVCMEMVNNTIKHANAKHIQIQLNQNQEYILFTYTDNGRGLPENYTAGQGFRNIEARVNILGGTFHINNYVSGFSASLQIPVNQTT